MEISVLYKGEETVLDLASQNFDAEWVSDNVLSLLIDGKTYELFIVRSSHNKYSVTVDGKLFAFDVGEPGDLETSHGGTAGGASLIQSPMPGRVIHIPVKLGDKVSEGSPVMTIEAMKMENEIQATKDGVVKEIFVKEGDTLEADDKLILIE